MTPPLETAPKDLAKAFEQALQVGIQAKSFGVVLADHFLNPAQESQISSEAEARKQQEYQSFTSQVAGLGGALVGAQTAAEVQSLISALQSLLATSSPIVHSFKGSIAAYINAGYKLLQDITEREERTQTMAEELRRGTSGAHPMDPKADRLAHALEKHFSKEQLEKFEAIDPKGKHDIIKLDEKGKIVEDKPGHPKIEEVSGQRMRDSISIYKALIARGDKRLTEKERQEVDAELDRMLEENSGIKAGDSDLVKAQKKDARAKQAILDVQGDSAKKKLSGASKEELPKKRVEIESDADKSIASYDSASKEKEHHEAEQRNALVQQGKAGMAAALGAAQAQEKQANDAALSKKLAQNDEWGDPSITPSVGPSEQLAANNNKQQGGSKLASNGRSGYGR